MRLIDELRREERSILKDLRTTAHFRRLEALREVLAHYDAEPPVGALLDTLMPEARRAAPAVAASAVIPLPGPRAEVA